MSLLFGKADRPEARRAALDTIAYLRDDPRRWKLLLRSAAAFAEELSVVLADAAHDRVAKKVRRVSRGLRAAALLPTSASTAVATKLVENAIPKGRS